MCVRDPRGCLACRRAFGIQDLGFSGPFELLAVDEEPETWPPHAGCTDGVCRKDSLYSNISAESRERGKGLFDLPSRHAHTIQAHTINDKSVSRTFLASGRPIATNDFPNEN